MRRTLIAAVVALGAVVAGGAFLLQDQRGERSGDTGATTTSTSAVDQQPTTSSTTSVPTTEAPPAVDNLDGIRWVVNDFDGVVDDQGRVLAPPAAVGPAARPTVARAIDGSLILIVADGELLHWPLDSYEPMVVSVDDLIGNGGDLHGLGHDEDGRVIVNPWDNPIPVPHAIGDGDSGLRQRSGFGPDGADQQRITAANGLTVEILPAEGEIDPEGGYLVNVTEPARLQVTNAAGEVDWTIPVGGSVAAYVDLVDFDGRHVMLARAPGEPADPGLFHFVYDLACPDGIHPTGCVDTFWARYGTASLVGPDREPGDDTLSPQFLALCPTMAITVATPPELIDERFSAEFRPGAAAAFEQAAMALSTCDHWAVGSPALDGLTYDPDDGNDGWLWSEFAAALRSPPRYEDGQGYVWTLGAERPAVVLPDETGQRWMEFRPSDDRPVGDVAVVVTPDVVHVAGLAEVSVAGRIREAAQTLADERGVEVIDLLAEGGPAPAADVVDDFLDHLGNTFPRSVAAGQVQLMSRETTAGEVSVSAVDSLEPTSAERDLAFLFAGFAGGGEGVFDELPLADEVMLALGSEVRALRPRLDLVRRDGWTVNASAFRGFEGEFNLLNQLPSPSAVSVGPLGECGFTLPTPAPPSLATYRRINITPADDSIDACLQWSSVSIYLDDDGVIRGVALDQGEP